MKVDVLFYPHYGAIVPLNDKIVVVLDILRATSTIVSALANGALEVIPVLEPSEAVDLVRGLGIRECVTGGERKGFKVDGFELGNSPLEYSEAKVAGKKVILSTSNGTKAIKWTQNAAEVIIGSYLNVQTVVDYLATKDQDLMIVCSGQEMKLGLEDLACAGLIAQKLESAHGAELTDAAKVARFTAEQAAVAGIGSFVKSTEHGRYLAQIGMEQDLESCVALDRYPILPKYRNGKIVIGERQ